MDAIRGATALLGPGLEAVDDALVLISGERILSAGRPAESAVPPGATVIDAAGTVLVPGFIDCHVHIGFYDPGRVLARGVTTARDLGWPPERIWPLVQRSRSDTRLPLLLAAGQMLTAPGGYPTRTGWAPPGTARVVDEVDDAVEAVDAQRRRGASVIKVALNDAAGPTLSGEVLEAVVAAAHERSLEVTGHVAGIRELVKALDAGVDELAHVLMSDERIPAELLQRMVSQSVTVVPTLSIRYGIDRRRAIDNLSRFLSLGGRVVYGTDLGNAGPRPGIDAREVGGMATAGMSVKDIVRAATVDAAGHLGLDDRGVIAAGMVADIVALRAEPLERARDLTRVAMVWRQGRRVR